MLHKFKLTNSYLEVAIDSRARALHATREGSASKNVFCSFRRYNYSCLAQVPEENLRAFFRSNFPKYTRGAKWRMQRHEVQYIRSRTCYGIRCALSETLTFGYVTPPTSDLHRKPLFVVFFIYIFMFLVFVVLIIYRSLQDLLFVKEFIHSEIGVCS